MELVGIWNCHFDVMLQFCNNDLQFGGAGRPSAAEPLAIDLEVSHDDVTLPSLLEIITVGVWVVEEGLPVMAGGLANV